MASENIDPTPATSHVAESRLKHGEWQPWIKEHCQFSLATAEAYMYAARCPESERAQIFSLRQMILYQRDLKRARKERIIWSPEMSAEKARELGVPEGHDLRAYAESVQGAKLVCSIMQQLAIIDPRKLMEGFPEHDRKKLRLVLLKMHSFTEICINHYKELEMAPKPEVKDAA